MLCGPPSSTGRPSLHGCRCYRTSQPQRRPPPRLRAATALGAPLRSRLQLTRSRAGRPQPLGCALWTRCSATCGCWWVGHARMPRGHAGGGLLNRAVGRRALLLVQGLPGGCGASSAVAAVLRARYLASPGHGAACELHGGQRGGACLTPPPHTHTCGHAAAAAGRASSGSWCPTPASCTSCATRWIRRCPATPSPLATQVCARTTAPPRAPPWALNCGVCVACSTA